MGGQAGLRRHCHLRWCAAYHRPMLMLDAAQTARALPWGPLVTALQRTLADHAAGQVQAPERWVLPVAPGTSWFLMPAWLAPEAGDLASIKLITYAAANAARGLPALLGDVLVMRASTGERLALLDGPTVTARRTAAVTLLAALHLAAQPQGPLLLIGTGVQALSHLQALAAGCGVREVWVRGRNPQRSRDFVQAALADDELQQHHGLTIRPADDLADALARCPLVVTVTPAQAPCLDGPVRPDAFIAAIGAFTPTMIELAPALTRQLAARGAGGIDSAAARHEAGELLAAGLALDALPTLAEALQRPRPGGSVLFKSCGAALWDLAAARCAVAA